MKNITVGHSKEILEKMFEVVGLKYNPELLKKNNWYQKASWSAKTEQEFIKWLGIFLYKNKYVRKGEANHEAIKMVGQYGWMTKG